MTRSASLATCFFGISLTILTGCQRSSESEFHTYKDATSPEATSDAAPTSNVATDLKTIPSPPKATPAQNGVVLASAEKPEIPAEVARPSATINPTAIDPTVPSETYDPSQPAAPSTDPVTVPAPLPEKPQVSTATAPAAAPAPVPVHDLALEIPPAPPLAESLAALTSSVDPMPARKMELLIPEKDFKVEGPEGALRVTFDDIDLLKVLNADPVPIDVEQHLPGWLSGLNGKMVRIRGWMFPPNQETDIPAFLFVRDNQICCFGRKPMVYDKFGVRLREGVTTNYILGRPFDVIGRMVVKSKIQNDELFWLYMIEDAVVIEN